MTNEEICEALQAHPEYTTQYMGLLWGQCERWVKAVAARYYYLSEWDDLIQAGYIGLHEAATRYDRSKGAGFLHYSEYWIRNSMQRSTIAPLDAASLDEPLTEDGEDDRYTVTPGEAVDPVETAVEQDIATILWQEVDNLDAYERGLILDRYRNGKGLKAIAADRLESYSRTNEGLRRARLHLSRNPRIRDLFDENYSYTSSMAYSSGRATHARFEGSTVERMAEGRLRALSDVLRNRNDEDFCDIAKLLNATEAPELWHTIDVILQLNHPEPPEDHREAVLIMKRTPHPEQVPHVLEICKKF